jgi:hypothetical protein
LERLNAKGCCEKDSNCAKEYLFSLVHSDLDLDCCEWALSVKAKCYDLACCGSENCRSVLNAMDCCVQDLLYLDSSVMVKRRSVNYSSEWFYSVK